MGINDINTIIYYIIFFTVIGLLQLLGLVFSMDFFVFLRVTRTSTSIGLWVIPIGIAITVLINKLLQKSNLWDDCIKGVNIAINFIRGCPFLYKVLKLAYKHPILAGLTIGTLLAVISVLEYFIMYKPFWR
jgi:hypothetical protein